MTRPNKAVDLARMLIKQAKMLKTAGMITEARAMARRAWDLKSIGHASVSLQPIPVRTNNKFNR